MHKESLLALKNPLIIRAIAALENPAFEEIEPASFGFRQVPRNFDGFEAEDVGVDSVKSLFKISMASLSEPGRISLFLQSAGGMLLSSNFHIPPEIEDEEYDCDLLLTVCEDTPSNRSRLMAALCEPISENISDQVLALNEHAPNLLAKILQQPLRGKTTESNGPSMG